MALCYPDTANWGCRPGGRPDDSGDEELEELVERSEALAWSTLAQLTGYQIGVCPVTVRPCAEPCNQGSYFIAPVTWSPVNGPFSPRIVDGSWVNVWCGCGQRGCSCTSVNEVILPGPVGRVDEVLIDGEVLDSSLYRVDNGNRLVRMDGERWPRCQDMNKPLGDDGTFGVTYLIGAAPDPIINAAAGRLASEFFNACTGATCALPLGVTTIVRQGVTYEVRRDFFEGDRTGLIDVDAVISLYNPNRLKRPTRIVSPDRGFTRFTTIG